MSGSKITTAYSLSPMQQGMVFHSAYDPAAGFYLQQMICTLREDLDVTALHKAWQYVVQRHSILRTTFRWEAEAPLQEVHDTVMLDLNEQDWRGRSRSEQAASLEEFLKADRRQGFELTKPPLMRLALFQLAAVEYQLVWTFHHALLDGRSHHLVLREVFDSYEAFQSGRRPELNAPRSYRDYIEWLARRDASDDEPFWRRKLAGITSSTSLEFGGPPAATNESGQGLQEIRLTERNTIALRSLAQRHEVTLSTLVQGTWALLLSYYSGAENVVFGAARAGRRSAFAGSYPGADITGAAEIVGLFINTLPLRLRVVPGRSLIKWLREVRRQNLEVRDFEHTPLLQIQKWSDLPNGVPLFESIVVFENYEINHSLQGLGGVWKDREFTLHERAHYPIVIAVYAGTELVIKLHYDRSRFSDQSVERVLGQLRALLIAFLSAPAENLSCADVMRYLHNDSNHNLTAITVAQDQETDQETECDVFPASFGQQRLWFLNQLEPGSAFYNIPLVASIKGALDPELLARAVNAIVARHETLRTTFATEDGELLQLIAPESHLSLSVVDLTLIPDGERVAAGQRLAKEAGDAPFDLARGPLLRVGLVKLGPDEHLLLVTMHHICSDGWSVRVFLDELALHYQAFLSDTPPELPELPVQYADCAAWQRELLKGEFLEKQLAYWRQQLAGAPAVLELPTDRPRPPAQTFRGERQTLELSGELRDRLAALSRGEGVTLFMTLLATFQTLLYRYSGREDIVVGSPTANRNRSEVEQLIGFFVNTLVLRTDFSGNPAFRKLLKRVREVALGAFTHQDVPFDRLVDELNPERSLSYAPLFQVIFSHEKAADLSVELAGLKITWLEVDRGTSKFDLALFVSEKAAGLSCIIEYDTDLFEAETIKRMLDHFQVILEGIVSNPDQRVGELPLLTNAEVVQLTARSMVESCARLPAACLHQAFEQQVRRAPDAVALTFESEQLTYQELNARANQLARHLRRQGVGPEVLVGLCLERSVEMMVGLLAILKAGGAYLPLDPAYPSERLSFMLDDAETKLLLTSEKLGAQFTGAAQTIFLIDREWNSVAHESKDDLVSNVVAENLAYVIYTSGSTGKPKGVPVTHRNVARLFESTAGSFEFTPNDVWTLFHSSAFDFSVWEIWGALLYGGRLVVVPYWVSRVPEDFLELLRREKVTVLNQTPSAFRQLVRVATSRAKTALALRYVIFGGEALELQSLKPWFELYGDRSPQLINMYGITETTVHVTYRPLGNADLQTNAGSVIGLPLDDLCVYLLDQQQQLVPRGVPGEMYVGGAGLSRGYLKRLDLTAERFVPDAFSGNPGARLYRSGDLARYLSNGDLEYLGRVDRQVKVRGFRIELGEIEAVLRQAPGVRDCVVLAHDESPGQTSLLAYVVSAAGQFKLEELRNVAKEKLPDYMVPAFFVPVDSIPLTANGKIDQRALPLPEKSRGGTSGEFVAPRNPTEAKLATMWGELLGHEQIGVHDSFFELGGHSLLATQVVSRVRDVFQVRISLRSFFEQPTIASLAQLVVATAKESPGGALPIRRLQRDEPAPTPESQS
jgi:amino acid adenylation domain-containing protein